MIIQSRFGAAQTGLGYQFYDATGALLGSRITAGITALPETGSYTATATVPSGSTGVYWNSSTSAATEDLREALVTAALEAAEQILLVTPYVPDESPALIIPAPDTDESLTVVYAYTENIINAKRAGLVLTFKLVTFPAKSERLLEVAAQTSTTDANGYAQISLQSDLRYRVTCRELGLEKIFTPAGETFDLLTLIP